jgi:DNA-binding CsgD family transcriptional regulator
VAAILDGLCRATGAGCCELHLRILPEGASARYRVGRAGSGPPLVVQAESEGRYVARWELCGAGSGPAASLRALDALRPVLDGALQAVIERWNATRQLEILAQILEVTDDAILLLDAEGEIRYANPRGEELLSIQTEKPMAKVPHGGQSAPLLHLILQEVDALRRGEAHVRHQSFNLGEEETWEMEVLPLSGPGRLGHAIVVASPVRLPGAEDIRDRLGRFGVSPREAEVLSLVLRGMKACEIATELSISQYTVKDHLKHAYAKLGISSRTQLVSRLSSDGALLL